MDKNTTILEAQWMEKEIPRIKEELAALKKLEQELLTTPLETVRSAYSDAYRASKERSRLFYRRRRRVIPTKYGYRERMVEAGLLSIVFRVLMVAFVALAVYVVYTNYQAENTQRGIVWASVLLIVGIALAFAPMVTAFFWERHARRNAERVAQTARSSAAFLEEKRDRQIKLSQCQERVAELEERLRFARLRYDELRQALTSGNHRGGELT
jgi:hypothetical protein